MPNGPETSPAPTVQASASRRGLVAAALGIAWGIFAFAAAAGVVGLGPAAAALGAIAGGLAARRWWKHPPLELDAAACSRGLMIVSAVATLAALVQIGRLTVYMVSPERTGCSSVPSSEWER